MREIKFRGKRKDNGSWVYGNYFCEDGWAAIQESSGNTHVVYLKTVGVRYLKKDRNDIDIYEGDIIRKSAEIELREECGNYQSTKTYPVRRGRRCLSNV
tara:strand:- start:527 stop:823 length:297 start_codon:yes stop_codon:yes gene_type:complete